MTLRSRRTPRANRSYARSGSGGYIHGACPASRLVGLLFDRSRVGSHDAVTAPPYDVVSETERRTTWTRARTTHPPDLGEELPATTGAEDKIGGPPPELEAWREQASWCRRRRRVLRDRDGPAARQPSAIRGLVCSVELEDWGGSIVPHERTMAGLLQTGSTSSARRGRTCPASTPSSAARANSWRLSDAAASAARRVHDRRGRRRAPALGRSPDPDVAGGRNPSRS
jgi:hypothetical protein